MKNNTDYKSVTSLEAAYAVNKQDFAKRPTIEQYKAIGHTEEEAEDALVTLDFKRVIRALNTDQTTGKVWEPNWNDHNEYKYGPWRGIEADDEHTGGFAFSGSHYVGWYTLTFVGSRLLLQDSERVYHMNEHFEDLQLKYFLILKKTEEKK
jgi:hypothetical protein